MISDVIRRSTTLPTISPPLRFMALLTSTVCRFEHFQEQWYLNWADRMQLEPGRNSLDDPERNISRKAWEWCAIAQALYERGMLAEGRQGLGFAVGTEPLASLFASYGASILGTDLECDEVGWATTNEHAKSSDHLFKPQLIDRNEFNSKVRFRTTDMRDISDFRTESFDFLWSSCSFEHLGSIDAGLQFVVDAMRIVKSGGVAVHTTEFNVGSNDETLTSGVSVIYRRSDIERLQYKLRHHHAALERVDYFAGSHQHDIDYDYPPYFVNGRKHVKLLLGPHIATSFLLIIRKGSSLERGDS